jgi:hypothetical protein
MEQVEVRVIKRSLPKGYKVYVYIVNHNYILGGMLFTIRKASRIVNSIPPNI